MKRIPYALAILTVAFLIGNYGNGGNPAMADSDKDAIQGKWKVISEEINGAVTRTDDGIEFIFSRDKVAIKDRDGTVTFQYKIYPMRNPKQLEVILNIRGGLAVRKHIYRLQGETLTMAWGSPGAPAPPKFTTRKGDLWVVAVLKRIKTGNK